MKTKKHIGITGPLIPDKIDPKTPFYGVRQSYVRLVDKAGGIPVIIPNTTNKKTLLEYVTFLDGLMISGGGDINPKYYQKKKHRLTGKFYMTIDEERDETELFLIRSFYKAGKPIFGICRGCQIINVAFGGNLTQDVNLKNKKSRTIHLHPMEKGGWDVKVHDVKTDRASRFHEIVQKNTFDVNSEHHQIVEVVGKDLRVGARAFDDSIEAIEHKNKNTFVLGVQWHPEKMADDPTTVRLMKQFLDAC